MVDWPLHVHKLDSDRRNFIHSLHFDVTCLKVFISISPEEREQIARPQVRSSAGVIPEDILRAVEGRYGINLKLDFYVTPCVIASEVTTKLAYFIVSHCG